MNERPPVERVEKVHEFQSKIAGRDGQPVGFAIRVVEFMNRVRSFTYSIGHVREGKFIPSIRHDLVPEAVMQLGVIHMEKELVVDADKKVAASHHRSWDQQIRPRKAGKPVRLARDVQVDFRKADDRSRKEREKNARVAAEIGKQ